MSGSGDVYARELVLSMSFVNHNGQIDQGLSLGAGRGLDIKRWFELKIAQAAVPLLQPLDPLVDQIRPKHLSGPNFEIGCRFVVGDKGRSCYREPPEPVQRSVGNGDDEPYGEGSSRFRLVLGINVLDPFVDVRCQVTIVSKKLLHPGKVRGQFRGVINVASD